MTTIRRGRRLVLGAGLVAALALAAVAVAQGEFEVPGFLAADDQRPVPTPAAGQRVLVLQVDLTADGDKVTARIRSQAIVDTFAPKSVARSAGDWEVRIRGDKELAYQVPNPMLDVEIENPEDEKNPYDTAPTEKLDWTLVVPLYDQGQPLGAKSIQVVDLATGNVVIEAEVSEQR